jgi:predicted alpha/beta-hydrolase family hydrolase
MSDEGRIGGRSSLVAHRSSLKFPDGAGSTVSGDLALPAGSKEKGLPLVILAHGAGNDMTSPFLVTIQEGIATHGWACLRFNFPYTERRSKAPDRAPVLEACYRAVVAAVRELMAPSQLVIGGKSLGGRMASHIAAAGEVVDGLVFLGYPLHAPGRTDRLRDAHLPRISAPMLLFAGTRDPLCDLDLLKCTLRKLKADTQLHVIPEGDHSFMVPKRTGRTNEQVLAEVVQVTSGWLAKRGRSV